MDDVEREIRAAGEAVFAAIQRRDREALARLTAADFVLRVPGAPDTDRDAFLAAIAAIPGEILAVAGEHVAVQVLGPELGLFTGVQVARVRLDGQELVDRGAFVDVFARRDGRWQLVHAFNVTPATLA